MSEKIKVTLDGTAETMLQSFYARAKYSLKKGHKFYDAKAVELVNKIDYDFSSAEEDSTMSNGVIARTLVFDELVEDFIDRNPDCTIVNIACGLDTFIEWITASCGGTIWIFRRRSPSEIRFIRNQEGYQQSGFLHWIRLGRIRLMHKEKCCLLSKALACI